MFIFHIIRLRMIKIIENATIIYSDGVKEQFEAVRLIDKGVIIGRVLDGEFMDCGFIPQHNIKHIKNGMKRKIPKKDFF